MRAYALPVLALLALTMLACKDNSSVDAQMKKYNPQLDGVTPPPQSTPDVSILKDQRIQSATPTETPTVPTTTTAPAETPS